MKQRGEAPTLSKLVFSIGQEMCIVEEPLEEFTSRHSLEWKFLFLDHRLVTRKALLVVFGAFLLLFHKYNSLK